MIETITEYYKMEFYDSYVIIEGIGLLVVEPPMVKKSIQTIVDHFDGKEFVIISNRKSDYFLNPDAYNDRIFKKVKGIAIVSQQPKMKMKALIEQERFQQSFAFFEDLDDAKNWAENFFVSY
jgi:hypothetical protein